MLINLVSNALKFLAEGTAVDVSSAIQSGTATLQVNDQEMGSAEEDQAYLFTSFFRGKNAVNIQGTGLGLHIVKRYADLLGGKIHLQSTLNKGTTVTLTFPINNAHGKDDSGD